MFFFSLLGIPAEEKNFFYFSLLGILAEEKICCSLLGILAEETNKSEIFFNKKNFRSTHSYLCGYCMRYIHKYTLLCAYVFVQVNQIKFLKQFIATHSNINT